MNDDPNVRTFDNERFEKREGEGEIEQQSSGRLTTRPG